QHGAPTYGQQADQYKSLKHDFLLIRKSLFTVYAYNVVRIFLFTSSISFHSAFSLLETLAKWKRQCDSCKEHPIWAYARIPKVCVKVLKLFVEKIGRANRDETVPLRQTVTGGRIDGPEVIATGPNHPCLNALKLPVLIKVSRLQRGAQPGRVEKAYP